MPRRYLHPGPLLAATACIPAARAISFTVRCNTALYAAQRGANVSLAISDSPPTDTQYLYHRAALLPPYLPLLPASTTTLNTAVPGTTWQRHAWHLHDASDYVAYTCLFSATWAREITCGMNTLAFAYAAFFARGWIGPPYSYRSPTQRRSTRHAGVRVTTITHTILPAFSHLTCL